MPRRQHIVQLTAAERRELNRLIGSGTAPARRLSHARILLKADTSTRDRRPTDAQIAEAVAVSARTVARVRVAYSTGGLPAALDRKPPDRVYPRKLDGAGEAKLIELACGPAPDGGTWSLRRLSETLVELHVVASIHHTTVGAVLKKTGSARPR
jgi:hypothetical protein